MTHSMITYESAIAGALARASGVRLYTDQGDNELSTDQVFVYRASLFRVPNSVPFHGKGVQDSNTGSTCGRTARNNTLTEAFVFH